MFETPFTSKNKEASFSLKQHFENSVPVVWLGLQHSKNSFVIFKMSSLLVSIPLLDTSATAFLTSSFQQYDEL